MTLDQAKGIIRKLIYSNFDLHECTLKYGVWNIRLQYVRDKDSYRDVNDRFYAEILKLDGISDEA